ncbi:MAG: radical SAM protein, partial [Oscillospiraceae bacterium]|nr:radical SAM protein [Oscillospiraceae bacterium]
MRIGGLQKMTLLDFPGKVACTVFLQGCNFRCPFCHNSPLLRGIDELSEESFFDFLKKRQGLLDGVAITGGEPLLNPEIGVFIQRIRDMGFSVKLDT